MALRETTNTRKQVGLNGKFYEGVYMGENFISQLFEPMQIKDMITNESRLEHGRRVTFTPCRFKHREFNLTLQLHAETQQDYRELKAKVEEIMYGGIVYLQVPERGDEVFRLRYLGNSVSYAELPCGTMGKMTFKMAEDDPSNRGEFTTDEKRQLGIK